MDEEKTPALTADRMAVRSDDGRCAEVLFAVKAANILDAGDLREAGADDPGLALLVSGPGGMVRLELQALISAARGEPGPAGQQGEAGAPGKSAWQYAVEGGYTGTEAEFGAALAQLLAPPPGALTTLTVSIYGGADPGTSITLICGDESVVCSDQTVTLPVRVGDTVQVTPTGIAKLSTVSKSGCSYAAWVITITEEAPAVVFEAMYGG